MLRLRLDRLHQPQLDQPGILTPRTGGPRTRPAIQYIIYNIYGYYNIVILYELNIAFCFLITKEKHPFILLIQLCTLAVVGRREWQGER